MVDSPRRKISLTRVLSCHPLFSWQVAFGLAIGLIALGALNAGLGYAAILLLMLSAFALLVAGMTLHGLLTYDLPLLRTGVQLKAFVRGPVAGSRRPLYHIAYLLPGATLDTPKEHAGVFLARNGYLPREDEPVVIVVSPADPDRMLEVTGLYESLIPPVWDERGAGVETAYRTVRHHTPPE